MATEVNATGNDEAAREQIVLDVLASWRSRQSQLSARFVYQHINAKSFNPRARSEDEFLRIVFKLAGEGKLKVVSGGPGSDANKVIVESAD
jgi:hypothetical protein